MQDILRIIKPYTVSLSEETLWYISVYNIPYKNASKNLPRYEYLENIKYRAQVFRPLKLGVYSWKPRVSDKLLRCAIKDSQHRTGKTFLKTDVTNFRCRNSQDIATGDTIIRSSQEWHPAELLPRPRIRGANRSLSEVLPPASCVLYFVSIFFILDSK